MRGGPKPVAGRQETDQQRLVLTLRVECGRGSRSAVTNERRGRRRVVEVWKQLWASPQRLRLGGESRHCFTGSLKLLCVHETSRRSRSARSSLFRRLARSLAVRMVVGRCSTLSGEARGGEESSGTELRPASHPRAPIASAAPELPRRRGAQRKVFALGLGPPCDVALALLARSVLPLRRGTAPVSRSHYCPSSPPPLPPPPGRQDHHASSRVPHLDARPGSGESIRGR